jgi:hypothetical protein
VNGVWDANEVQGERAGEATSYDIMGQIRTVGVDADPNEYIDTIEIQSGDNDFPGEVTYLEGPQPYNSDQVDFDSPYPAGTSPQEVASVIGVYPLFASTVDITVDTEQPLYNMFNVNSIELDLVAESGGEKQFFEIPQAWLDVNPIAAIQFFNPVSNQFDPTNQLSTFIQEFFTKTIEGNVVDYVRYRNSSADRGALTIKLIF